MDFGLQIKSVNDNAGTFKGLASTWTLDRLNDVIVPGAFTKTLQEWNARGANVPLLWNHDQGEPIGAIVTATETAEGLEVEGQLALDVGNAKRAYSLAKTGALAMSIGYGIPAGGYEMKSGVRHIKQIELAEISLVAVPANPGAILREVKSVKDCNTIREYEDLLREALGLSAREAKRVASKSWQVLNRDGSDQTREASPDEVMRQVRKSLGLPIY